ncbi:hypothetical protein OE810_10005 [Rhodobacteraceae bacterium XHP0102]|nr:hypothetical protein [Rhodobacteraceae bacterium XHP0102]
MLSLASTIIIHSPAKADAVSNSMRDSMQQCTIGYAGNSGAPIQDIQTWSEVVGAATAAAFARVNLFGPNENEDLENVMVTTTTETIINTLERNGYAGFRKQVADTVAACMPGALVVAFDEMASQQTAFCPDDTDYLLSVQIIKMSHDELINKYGANSQAVLRSALFNIELSMVSAFPHITRYGQSDYPSFENEGDLAQLHNSISSIDLKNVFDARPMVDSAVTIIDSLNESSERIDALYRELTCFKDWLDVYPTDDIARLRDNN